MFLPSVANVKDIVQIAVLPFAIWGACQAYKTYSANSRLEHARWTVRMYEKFFEQRDLKAVRDALDCPPDSSSAATLIEGQPAELTDYLNFFELLAILRESKQMSGGAIEDMFGYYLDCIQRQRVLVSYVGDDQNGFEKLNKYLQTRKTTRAS